MTEDDYWPRLEYRVTREFAVMADAAFRSFWCDGFVPEQFRVSENAACITGVAWIGTGARQARWEFRLDLPGTVLSRTDVLWAELLPPDDRSGWLTIDVERRVIRIDPSAG